MFGIDDIINTGLKIIDKVLPDQKSKDEAKIKLLELQQNGAIKLEEFKLEKDKLDTQLAVGQTEVNKIEASSQDKYASRWRPTIGWVCALSFAYDFILRPLLNGSLSKYGLNFPQLDSATLSSLTFGLLGLGAMRSFDKYKK
jgi:hypothetical protein